MNCSKKHIKRLSDIEAYNEIGAMYWRKRRNGTVYYSLAKRFVKYKRW